jgi:release factor glutamine methyltransferase
LSGFHAEGTFWDVSADEDVLIKAAVDQLSRADLGGALGEVRRLWATSHGDAGVFDGLVTRRAAREPLSHLLGYRDFYKHQFEVSSDVLDPRPDTETLVEVALGTTFDRVLDLGTGSGCILLSLLAERRAAMGVGTDLSDAALSVAARNAEKLGVENQVSFIVSDWFAEVDSTFDLIVSNPPYIAVDEMGGLQPEVRDHEPRMALTDEGDGLACYRTIFVDAPAYLKMGGHLMVEIGPTQAGAVKVMMATGGFAKIRTIQDLDGRDRVVSGQKLPS